MRGLLLLIAAGMMVGCGCSKTGLEGQPDGSVDTVAEPSTDPVDPADTMDVSLDEPPAGCGNGIVEPGEECDDGPGNSDTERDACRTDCTNPRCGDGVRDTYEECDDGNDEILDGCFSCAIGEILVNAFTEDRQTNSDLALFVDGSIVVVWSGTTAHDEYHGVSGRLIDSTGIPGAPDFRVSTYTESIQSDAAIATPSAGHFMTAWQSNFQDGDRFGVFGQAFHASTSPEGSEFQVNTYTESNQGNVSVACDLSTRCVAVWDSDGEDGDSFGVYGRFFSIAGSPSGPEFAVNTYTEGDQSNPSVSMSEDGYFVVVWMSNEQDGDGTGVFGQRFDPDGEPIGEEFQVNTLTENWQGFPSVAMNMYREFVVVWTDQAVSREVQAISAQVYNSDGSRDGTCLEINEETDRFLQSPDVGILPGGDFIVVWTSMIDDHTADVRCSLFNASGERISEEFSANKLTNSDGFPPSIDVDGVGRFAVTWASRTIDEHGDIFIQRFATGGDPLGTLPW